MRNAEFKEEDGKIFGKCCGCGKWVDVTSIIGYIGCENWHFCDDCQGEMSAAWGPRDEIHAAALDHKGLP